VDAEGEGVATAAPIMAVMAARPGRKLICMSKMGRRLRD
jgi:hypothetical protein